MHRVQQENHQEEIEEIIPLNQVHLKVETPVQRERIKTIFNARNF